MLANLLLLLGLSMIVGDTKYSEQKIGYQAIQFNITLLAIILIYLTISSIIPLAPIFDKSITPDLANKILLDISFYFSVIILITYIYDIYFIYISYIPEKLNLYKKGGYNTYEIYNCIKLYGWKNY